MAITREKKTQILANLADEFQNSGSVAFAAYRGLSVAELTTLRRELREVDARLIVAKKTLVRLAAEKAGFKELPAELLEGPVAVIFSHGEALAGLQQLYKFGAKNDPLQLLGSILDGEILDTAKTKMLAQLPGREALLGQLVGLLAAPLRGIAGVSSGVLSGFVRVLSEVQKKQAEAA